MMTRNKLTSLFGQNNLIINFIFTDNLHIYCSVYPVMLKSPKQLPNFLKKAETIVVLIVFNVILCDVHTVTIFFYRSAT